MRAVRANGGAEGFEDDWVIGGVEFDLQYLACMGNPRVFPDSDASRGVAVLGPPGCGAPWFTSAGEGPFIEIALDRQGPVVCTKLTPIVFKVENLLVTDVNGEVLLDRRGEGDSSDLVEMIVVDTDA